MEKLILSEEGVFPVVYDEKGQLIKDCPKTGMQISGTVQGEGKLAGVPSLFIRLSGCNLRCIWQKEAGDFCGCDTSHASFFPKKTQTVDVSYVFNLVKHNIGNMRHVVITGGEPVLQQVVLAKLCQRIKEELELHITIETNGTLFNEELCKWIDLFSISPKLRNSIPSPEKLAQYDIDYSAPFKMHAQKRYNLEVLQSYIDLCNSSNKELQLKFVVGRNSDREEIITDYLNKLTNYHKEDILLMPLGANVEELHQSSPLVLEMAIANGWRFTPRIHIELFGAKIGV